MQHAKGNSKVNSFSQHTLSFLIFAIPVSDGTGVFNCLWMLERKPLSVENRSPKKNCRLCWPAEPHSCNLGNFFNSLPLCRFRMAFKLLNHYPVKHKCFANTCDFWVICAKIARILPNILIKSGDGNLYFSHAPVPRSLKGLVNKPKSIFFSKRSTQLLIVSILSEDS